ncbi:MAG TPA: hypothetical protein VGG03_13680, partial [Thermoanaerobaculia bacterium]
DDAFAASVEQVDFEHGIEQLVERLSAKLEEHSRRGYETSDKLKEALARLAKQLRSLIRA